jgi:hypothetical protein
MEKPIPDTDADPIPISLSANPFLLAKGFHLSSTDLKKSVLPA